jgi:hypothetical protein
MIDPSTGLMKWLVPKDFKGRKEVSIAVKDGQGGAARYQLLITIQ